MIKEGSKVKWKWGNGTATGKVKTTYTKEVTKTIKGSEITRKGEDGNKALYIEQEDSSKVLKLESEVEKVDWKIKEQVENSPKMKIKYKRKRLIYTFVMAMIWLILGVISLVFSEQSEMSWFKFAYLFISLLYFFQFFYNLKMQYGTVTADSIEKHELFSSKEIEWKNLITLKKVAGDYKLYSADKKMTINPDLIDKDSLSDLEAVFKKYKPWNIKIKLYFFRTF